MIGKSLISLAFTLLALALGSSSLAQTSGGATEAAAEASRALRDTDESAPLPVFGSQLFTGPPATSRLSTEPSYVLQKGDRIAVRAFGAYNTNVVEEIDQNGMLFIPEVGPVDLAGRRAGELQSLVEAAVQKTFTQNVRVYATMVDAGAISVYVSGDVNQPGRYLGASTDDVLFFLQAAAGINAERGSFRDIRVIRRGKVVARIDLYAFLFEGRLVAFDFMSGDTVFVTGRGPLVEAAGEVLAPFAYEILTPDFGGERLITVARPTAKATHVVLSGVRDGQPFTDYLTLKEFTRTTLEDGDRATFRSDAFGRSIAVAIQSTSDETPALKVVPRDARLAEILAATRIDPARADLQSIHIKRKSVAEAQKVALNDSLDRLERSVALNTGFSAESAQVQRAAAESIGGFIASARLAEPMGIVTVIEDGALSDLVLEDGDIIVIPDQTDVVMVAGEVVSPGAFVAGKRDSVRSYIDRAGGFQTQANRSDFVVVKRSGAALKVKRGYIPEAGDQILVLPRTGNRSLLIASEITQVIFQLALATATVARL
ncbi:MAG: polysaccharide biosynthesis/export family protein [Pseudomonadota bacterium]